MDKCLYCSRPAKQKGTDVAVCQACMVLLKNPATALPLIRGHLTMTLRGKLPEADLKIKIDSFMEMISSWNMRIKN